MINYMTSPEKLFCDGDFDFLEPDGVLDSDFVFEVRFRDSDSSFIGIYFKNQRWYSSYFGFAGLFLYL